MLRSVPRLLSPLLTAAALLLAAPAAPAQYMHGYLGVPNEAPGEEYGGGYSMYVAAWPLLEEWPGSRFQTGLFGTWMFAQKPDPAPEGKIYSDIEGGLGWWRDTRFATATPKFIMGGVTLNFATWANGPGAGKGRDWDQPRGKYGVAQLSPWVVWPPDGLNLAQGTCGELFGYGYLPLPLTEAKATTAGHEVPTGDQCWTLFLNTANFKGPVAFFTPWFFSQHTIDRPDLAGVFLDSRPADPRRAVQMETQYVPAVLAEGRRGVTFARTAPTRFPSNDPEGTVLVHAIASYRRDALWDAVDAWFDGGPAASGRVDPGAIPLMLDGDGNITETNTGNFFFVADGKLHTSSARNVLGGVTRATILELAAELGIEAVEGNYTPYDVYAADEAFVCSTTPVIMPTTSLNGAPIGGAGEDGTPLPGPVTLRLMQAFMDRAGMDFVAQAMSRLGDNAAGGMVTAWKERVAATES